MKRLCPAISSFQDDNFCSVAYLVFQLSYKSFSVRCLILDFQPYILQTTQEYVSMFFDVEPDLAPPVFEKSFCNYHEMPVPVVQYRRGIDELIRQDTHLYKGHVVHLWPDGYKVRAIAP